MFARIGPPELLILLVIVILIFGVGRLSEVGGALGKAIRDFRRAVKEADDTGEVLRQDIKQVEIKLLEAGKEAEQILTEPVQAAQDEINETVADASRKP